MLVGKRGMCSVLPTRVGVDRGLCLKSWLSSGSPHTRGGGPLAMIRSMVVDGFSPHAWGWTANRGVGRGIHRVLPTRVGVDRVVPVPVNGS